MQHCQAIKAVQSQSARPLKLSRFAKDALVLSSKTYLIQPCLCVLSQVALSFSADPSSGYR